MGKIVDGIYYGSNGLPSHRGVVKVGHKLYYAGEDGVIVKDRYKVVYKGMTNDLVEYGEYYFDKHGVLILSKKKKSDTKKKKTKKKAFSKTKNRKKKTKNEKNKAAVIALIIVLAAVAVSGVVTAIVKPDTEENDTNQTVQSGECEIYVSEYQDDVYLCSDSLKSYYNGKINLTDAIFSKEDPYKGLTFSYSISYAESATLKLSKNEDMTDAVEYKLNVDLNRTTLDNLYTGTQYYYVITAYDKNGVSTEYRGSFKTAATNRFISVSGVYNARDIGGYNTIYNKKIKQGLLIRGTELDGIVNATYILTDPDAMKQFGFVYDFDLRSSEITNVDYVSPLGENVEHRFYGAPMYGNIFAAHKETILKQIFTDLADPANYPMYMHCTFGSDRTGTVIYLLQGLLGVSEEDMLTEFSLSGYLKKDLADGAKIGAIKSGLQGVAGDTINEKIENYMIDTVGITPEQIQSIRNIFLGD